MPREKYSQTEEHRYNVFLSHNRDDQKAVFKIAKKLKQAGLKPWLNEWCAIPGGDWQDNLSEGLRSASACAVFIGPHGIGSWEKLEYKVATDRMARDYGFRVFLVLLPDLAEPFCPTNLPCFLTTRSWVDFRRGCNDEVAFQSLVNAIKGIPNGPSVSIDTRQDVCPYRGLQIFDEEHSEYFFGRSADVQRLLEKLKATRFLAVIGQSGTGKSSLVRAGLIPALRNEALPESNEWTTRVFRPGAHPLVAMASHLLWWNWATK